jgi:hypothetical protein
LDEFAGTIQRRELLLNNDIASNGENQIDIFNDDEAITLNLNEFERFSSRIESISLDRTSLNLLYETNLGVDLTLYLAIVGINATGKAVYLSPKSGQTISLGTDEEVAEFAADGAPISSDNILKIPINRADTKGQVSQGDLNFNTSNSTVDAFFSNLPVEVRVLSKAVLNPDSQRGFVSTPVHLNTELALEIPLDVDALTGTEVISDSTKANFDFIPSPNDDEMEVEQGELQVDYVSGIPFGVELMLEFRDAQGQQLFTLPDNSTSGYQLNSGNVNPETGFVTDPMKDKMVISLSDQQIEQLHRVRSIYISGSLKSDETGKAFKLRSSDFIELKVSGRFAITTSVNGE